MSTRRPGGRHTWWELREWDRGATDAERLAARVLRLDGFTDVDPSHPRGGPDGGSDIRCLRDNATWAVCVHFPHGEHKWPEVRSKFESDLAKVREAGVDGVVFFTNQEVRLAERKQVAELALPLRTEVYHLERVALLLDEPRGYPLRLEFLSIEMTREEQLAFFSQREADLVELLQELRASKSTQPPPAGVIPTVRVEQHEETMSLYHGLGGTKLMECRKCSSVFRAEKPITARMSVYGIVPTISETVTCPVCGTVQRFQ